MKSLTKELIKNITSCYGDSFYILDSDVFQKDYNDLLMTFRKYYSDTYIAYSYKTNYIPRLCKIIGAIGAYSEIVSEMELDVAERIGIEEKRIIWNGPIKNQRVVESFLLNGGTVNIDSIDEFLGICNIAKNNPDIPINIGVRCNYEVGDEVLSRFGIDISGKDIDYIFSEIARIDNLNLKMLQSHFARRHYKYWKAKAIGMLDIYDRVVDCYGLKPSWLDLGGGISGNMPNDLRNQLGLQGVSFEKYAMMSAKMFYEHFKNKEDKPKLFIEPGTALAANCMRFVCRVESIKDIRGKTIVTVNGSQKNINMVGINPPMEVIHFNDEPLKCCDADIAGYTCIESDYLYKNFSGMIGRGDYLVFGSCGSYSVVMKPPFILPNVPIIDISSGKIEEIKCAEDYNDIFNTYLFDDNED